MLRSHSHDSQSWLKLRELADELQIVRFLSDGSISTNGLGFSPNFPQTFIYPNYTCLNFHTSPIHTYGATGHPIAF